MAKDPAFLFYYQDWLVGTYFLNRKEKGAYMDLLCYQADKGYLTTEIINEVLNGDIECWQKLKDKFIEEEGKFYNKRLKEEREKRKLYSESRSKNRSKICKTYDSHMEDENENENRDINRIEEREEIFKKDVEKFKNYPAYMLKEFIDYWSEQNPTGKKMRFELEKTWDLKRRLERWSANSKLKAPVTQKKKNSPNVERILNEDYKKYNVDIAGISENFKKVGDERNKKT